MITKLCIALSFALMVYGCAVERDPREMKGVGVTLVKEVIRTRMTATGYRDFSVWLYVDHDKNQYELDRYEGLRATIYLKR